MNATTVAPRKTYDTPLNEAARIVGLSPRRFRQRVLDGEVFGMKDKSGQWLFTREDLQHFAELKPGNTDACHDKLVEELLAVAPELSPARKARISAALHESAVA